MAEGHQGVISMLDTRSCRLCVSPTVVGSMEGICMGVSTGFMGMIERPSQSLLDPISKTRTWGLGGCRARRRDRRGVVPTPRPDAEKREEPVSIPVAL
jgi:hypothetical protein